MDLKSLLYQDRIKEIEDDLLPFGYHDDGINNVSNTHNEIVKEQRKWMDI